jgi:hypothetical protein
VQVGGITKGIWPKGNADRLRPALVCVKKLLPGTLGQVLDGSLHYSFLKVGIDPAEGESLIALLACHLEVVVGKSTIVTVIMFDPNAVMGSKLFKCLLDFNCFQQVEIACHEINKNEP